MKKFLDHILVLYLHYYVIFLLFLFFCYQSILTNFNASIHFNVSIAFDIDTILP